MADCLEEEAADEIEAMAAIMGEGFERERSSRFALALTPQFDPSSQTAGTLILSVTLPPGYPSTTHATVCVLSVKERGSLFPELQPPSEWTPSHSDREKISAIIRGVVESSDGAPVVFDAVEAVREWLEANTLEDKVVTQVEQSGVEQSASDDDDLEEEDMDGELIEALRPILRGDGKRLKALDEAASLKEGSTAQRTALKAIWRSLTEAQKARVVESSDDEDLPATRSNNKQRPLPPAAKRECPKGHTLTPLNTKPSDYSKLEGNVFNCDVCDSDGKYSGGAYHCDTCKNWDCCVRCGARTNAANVSNSAKSKGQKGMRR